MLVAAPVMVDGTGSQVYTATAGMTAAQHEAAKRVSRRMAVLNGASDAELSALPRTVACAVRAWSPAGGVGPPRTVGVVLFPLSAADAVQCAAAPPSQWPANGASASYQAHFVCLDGGGGEGAAALAMRAVSERLSGSNAAPLVCMHSAPALGTLSAAGCALPPPLELRVADVSVMAWLLEPDAAHEYDSASSKAAYPLYPLLAARVGGGEVSATAAYGAGSPLERAGADCRALVTLWRACRAALDDAMPVEALRREMRLAAVLQDMGRYGLPLVPRVLAGWEQAVRVRVDELVAAARGDTGLPSLNLASPAQVANALYETLDIPIEVGTGGSTARTKTGRPTDEGALTALKRHCEAGPGHRLPGIVLEFRRLSNFLHRFIESDWAQAAAAACRAAGARAERDPAGRAVTRVRCAWNQTSTATGRLSSSNPNLQAVDKGSFVIGGAGGGDSTTVSARDAFVAPAGRVLLSADYSQIELRVLAHLTKDAALLEALQQAGTGGDTFRMVARTWLGVSGEGGVSDAERENAKRVAYGIIYGQTEVGLAPQLNVTAERARELIASFLNHFGGVSAWLSQVREQATADGRVVLPSGRWRHLPNIQSEAAGLKRADERKAVNTIVQGTAAEIMKDAMLAWAARQHALAAASPDGQGAPVIMLGTIHDELLFEVDVGRTTVAAAAQMVREAMEGVAGHMSVPIVAKVQAGATWSTLAAVEA
ncbi:unnamed protein product [Pedinophyceae sp. YPF-701]|nr:unnamed protein product [Pedinophyceae sp. YPF-701]